MFLWQSMSSWIGHIINGMYVIFRDCLETKCCLALLTNKENVYQNKFLTTSQTS